MNTTDNILVIDLEATCWNGPIPQGQVNEIIEIGICILNAQTGEVSDPRGILIKPERSTVSPFCTELTTITQEMLDQEGISFEDACDIVRDEYEGHYQAYFIHKNFYEALDAVVNFQYQSLYPIFKRTILCCKNI